MEKATNKYIRTISTRRMEGEDPIQTELTLDCSNLTQRDFIEYALQSLVVKWQGVARRNALKAEGAIPIPRTATWTVPKPGTKTVLSIEQMIASLSKEKKAEILRMLLEQSEDEGEDE